MAQGTVVLVGSLPVERLALDLLVAEFGWSLKAADTLDAMAELNVDHNLVAVLFSPRSLALTWELALHAILDAAPRALPIICHSIAEAIDWPRVAEAGGFHSLQLPFSIGEVRQSLGFVWDANCRGMAISIRQGPRLIDIRKPTLQSAVQKARIVA